MESPGEYVLKDPIQRGEKEEPISKLIFVTPRAKHFQGMNLQNSTMSDTLVVFGKLCGQPKSVIDELSMRDVAGISELLAPFL